MTSRDHGTWLLVGPRFAADTGDAEALEVDARGRIVRVWPRAPPHRDRVELPGVLALPGLHDAHLHVVLLGRQADEVDLRGASTPAEVRERVAAFVRARPGLGAVRGRGWDQARFPAEAFPSWRDLEAAADVPVALTRVDGHALWVNRAALALAGHGPPGTDPPGGRVLRDAAGRPTGVLIDRAMEPVLQALPPWTAGDVARQAAAGVRRAAAAGLVAVHAMSASVAEVEDLVARDRAERLPLRVFAYLDGADPASWAWLAEHPPGRALSPRVAVCGVKLFADGALGSRGAALLADYSDEPGCRGLLLHPPRELARQVARAEAGGWQAAVHAIGDRANRVALDAIEAARTGASAVRHRVEHAQVLHPADLDRFRALGAIASMQPAHCTDDAAWAGARLGPARLAGAYAWRTLVGRGAALAFGSDAPIASERPLLGLHAALTRERPDGWPAGGWRPDERLGLPAALHAYTAGAALAVGRDGTLGRVAPGFSADLTLLDRDPRAVPGGWLRARPVGACLGGRLVGG